MSRSMTVEELRANLDDALAEVESRNSVTITRDGKRIATLGPTIVHRGKRFPFRDFDPGPRPRNLTIDVVEFLREDRDRERSDEKFPA